MWLWSLLFVGTAVAADFRDPGFVAVAAADENLVVRAKPTVDAKSVAVKDSVSREYVDDDVVRVMSVLAEEAGMDIFFADGVAGKITMRVERKTAFQTLHLIAKLRGLVVTEQDGVTVVSVPEPPRGEVVEPWSYRLQHAKAENVATVVKSQLQVPGEVTYDGRTNTVYYRDVGSNAGRLHALLEGIDVPARQVLIEARIVEISTKGTDARGINWSEIFGSENVPQSVTIGQNALPGFSFRYGILSLSQLSVAWRYLIENTRVEVLSAPAVMTSDGIEASIKVVRRQPVPEMVFSEEQAKTVFSGFREKEFGNFLRVRPRITSDNRVSMEIAPEVSSKVGDAKFTLGGSAVSSPIIDTRSLVSTVTVRSGQTVVLGGLKDSASEDTKGAVPGLSRIPIVGAIFRDRGEKKEKRELVIFLTPKVQR